MLKVNVGLSRKVSRDFNSTGFSLNLEGELCGSVDDPETLIERIKEYYDLADEALRQQVERYESESAIASRDEEPVSRPKRELVAEAPPSQSSKPERETPKNGTSNGHSQNQPAGEAATNKQIQFLLNLGKRNGLTQPQLEKRFEQQFGRRVGVYELSKREAGEAITALNGPAAPTSNGNGRGKSA
jgi:ribulose bisphosphate carboxylase small subunit